MTNPIKEHLIRLLDQGVREDERSFDHYRDVSVEYHISPKSSEGSARVKIGNTDVVAGIKVEIGEPYSDKPDEGSIIVSVELLPMSSPDFESGPPSIDAIELSRVVDRGIREGKALNFKKLCITPKEKIWTVLIDIYPLNDSGNLFDAAALAALAALQDARFPAVEDNIIQYGTPTDKKLPLEKLPISVTVHKIGKHILIDPSTNEEAYSDARLTVAVLENGDICALQKGGDESISFEDVDAMTTIALTKALELRKALKQ